MIRLLLAPALLCGIVAEPAAAQVAAETALDADGYGTARVRNASAEIVDVVVELRHGTVAESGIELGPRASAVVSPERFVLGPGETQTLRLLVRAPLHPDTVLRLVTTLTPQPPPPAADTAPGPRAQLIYATRFVTRVVRRE
jgi:P pilus assembly chaperone PapD